jgi:diacylglycerol kinase family enzyme
LCRDSQIYACAWGIWARGEPGSFTFGRELCRVGAYLLPQVNLDGAEEFNQAEWRAAMKILLIVNPSASGVTARGRVMIQNALAAEHDLTVAETKRRGHATRMAQGASAQGIELVVSLGGDGTVNEVANGLVRTPTALGVLPGGSTNVFARTIGFVNEPVEATTQLLEAIGRSSIRRVGLGNVNGRFFLFHVGMGYDAAVVEQVERRGQLKRWLGHPLFMFAAVDTWARRFDRKHAHFRVSFGPSPSIGSGAMAALNDPNALPFAAQSAQSPTLAPVRMNEPGETGSELPTRVTTTSAQGRAGESIGSRSRANKRSALLPPDEIDGFFAIAMNTDPYTYLGPRALSLCPEANFDNPLSLVTLKKLDLVGTLGAVTAAIRGGGRLAKHRNVDVRTHLTGFTVRAHRPFPWQVDGDHLGNAELLDFRYEPEVLSLVVT